MPCKQFLALSKAPLLNNVTDSIASEKGCEILQLFPYHLDKNPVEMICSEAKRTVASKIQHLR